MTAKNKVVVRIMDREYTIVSDDPREYVQKVAYYVDDKMRETFSKNKKLSTSMAAVLTSLNIADEYFKVQGENEELEKRMSDPRYELKKAKEELRAVTDEFEQRNQAYEKMIAEFASLIENSAVYESGVEKLRQKVQDLNDELVEKEKLLDQSNATKDQLEKDLKKSKMELEEFIDTFD